MRNEVYKIYSKFNREGKGQFEYLLNVFEESKIYLSNPSDFNDPYDVIVFYDFESASEEEVIEFLSQYEINRDIDEITKVRKSELLRTNQGFREMYFENIRTVHNSLRNKTGVYCLTENIENLLMWGHYGDNHKGIAIGFDKEVLQSDMVDIFFKDVDYKPRFPSIKQAVDIKNNASTKDEATRDLMKIHLFRKSTDWRYEKEWRLLKLRPNDFTEDERKVSIPPKAITSICFGSKILEKDQEFVLQKVREIQNFKHIKFFKMMESSSSYSIKKQPL